MGLGERVKWEGIPRKVSGSLLSLQMRGLGEGDAVRTWLSTPLLDMYVMGR